MRLTILCLLLLLLSAPFAGRAELGSASMELSFSAGFVGEELQERHLAIEHTRAESRDHFHAEAVEVTSFLRAQGCLRVSAGRGPPAGGGWIGGLAALERISNTRFSNATDSHFAEVISLCIRASHPGAVRAWAVAFARGVPGGLRRNQAFLNAYARALIERSTISKHLKGEINSSGVAVGGHMMSAIDGVKVRLRPNQTPPFPKYFDTPSNRKLKEAYIDIKDGSGNWVPKSARSTFFPPTWDEDRVLEEMARVQSVLSNKVDNRIWKGTASDGTQIEIRYTGANINNLSFSTVYANY